MDKQAIFNKVVGHARAQKCRSRDTRRGLCLYNKELEDGTVLHCFIGVLFPKGFYDPLMEGKSIYQIWRQLQDALNLSADTQGLLESLQTIHDDTDVLDWEQEFVSVAKGYGLEVPPHEQGTVDK